MEEPQEGFAEVKVSLRNRVLGRSRVQGRGWIGSVLQTCAASRTGSNTQSCLLRSF